LIGSLPLAVLQQRCARTPSITRPHSTYMRGFVAAVGGMPFLDSLSVVIKVNVHLTGSH